MLSVSSPETQKSLQEIWVYRLSREVKLPKMSFDPLTLACESKSLQQILVHRLNREVVLSSSKFWFTGLAGKSYYKRALRKHQVATAKVLQPQPTF